MNFDPCGPRVDVALVFLREDHGSHAGSSGAEGFLVDAADGLHLAGERDLAGDGDVLTERLLSIAERMAQVMAQPADGPSIFPPPMTLMWRS